LLFFLYYYFKSYPSYIISVKKNLKKIIRKSGNARIIAKYHFLTKQLLLFCYKYKIWTAVDVWDFQQLLKLVFSRQYDVIHKIFRLILVESIFFIKS